MENKKLYWKMLLIAIVLGMLIIGCETGTPSRENMDPKTLIIQNMPANIFTLGADGFMIGIFPVGTTNEQAENFIGIIAGADEQTPGWSFAGTDPVTLTLPLYNIVNDNRWTGNGTFDIFAILGSGPGTRYFKATSVNINSAVTHIPWGNAIEIFQ